METQGIRTAGDKKVPEFNDPLSWNSKELKKVPNLINEGEVGKRQELPASAPCPEQFFRKNSRMINQI